MAVELIPLDNPSKMDIVNVASVPMRSPFRYPGGKTWLVPRIRKWLQSQPRMPAELIEPFAGGGIVSLTAVFENLVSRATMVELDPDIASVWATILNGLGLKLAQDIVSFRLTPEAVTEVLNAQDKGYYEKAFATILRNRVSRGGILAPGAGLVKNGENGKGLASRWYPETLRKRILDIVAVKHRISFTKGDGVGCMEQNAKRQDVVFFIDPPYTVAGRRLYTYSDIDHVKLFNVARNLTGDFLITYDDTTEIRHLAKNSGFQVRSVPMKNTHHAQKMELLISRNLDWLEY